MLVLAILLLPVVLGLIGLAVEGGVWYSDRHDLRSMADSAAMAAGWARRDSEDEDDAADEAVLHLGFDDDTDTITVNSPPSEGDYTNDDNAIEVIVQRTRPLLLTTLFTTDREVEIVMRAVAQVQQIDGACVLALNPSASGAIDVSGSASLDLTGCGMTANSNSGDAIEVSGSATVAAPYLKTQGGIDVSKDDNVTASRYAHSSAAIDPFADVEVTVPAGCTYTKFDAKKDGVPPPGSTFCNGFDVGANTTLTLAAGTYYIKSGDFQINGQGGLYGDGVTFVFSGDACATINGGADVGLTAPLAGDLAGLVFYSQSTCDDAKINGGADMAIDGAVYFPNADIKFSGNSSTGADATCTRIIGSTVSFSGSSALANDCSDYGIPMTDNADPRLVE